MNWKTGIEMNKKSDYKDELKRWEEEGEQEIKNERGRAIVRIIQGMGYKSEDLITKRVTAEDVLANEREMYKDHFFNISKKEEKQFLKEVQEAIDIFIANADKEKKNK